MARPKKKYHYIYKTTCNLNGKYYIGMHSTSNLEDGYMGSGKRLRYSIRKYGVENHTREILEFLDDRESLVKREVEIVNEELINDPLCINLAPGGQGGFISKEGYKKGAKKMLEKMWADSDYRAAHSIKASIRMKKMHEDGIVSRIDWTGKKHKDSSIQKMRDSHKDKHSGYKNSQFGTCWITNETENKKIKKGDLIPDGWRLGRKLITK